MVHGGDAHAMSEAQDPSRTTRHKTKKDGLNGTGDTLEAAAPEDRSPNWDNDADHSMLSYFLGVDSQASPQTQPLHGARSANERSAHQTRGVTFREPISTPASRNFASLRAPSGQVGNVSYDDDSMPPSTPAIQYYHHSLKPQANARPSNASRGMQPDVSRNNPMMGMKATFAQGTGVGGPSPHESIAESMSPISPTALIGPGHEPLMLPPPSPQTTSTAPVHQAKPKETASRSHMEFIQHINALAKQASANTLNGVIPTNLTATAPQHTPQAPPVAMQPVAQAHYSSLPGTVLSGVNLPPGYIPAPVYYTQAALQHLHQQSSVPESEEKRAKRLERNRESARKSRRRKKVRLAQLEEKVAELHGKIEALRREQIDKMNPELQSSFSQRLRLFKSDLSTSEGDEDEQRTQLQQIVDGSDLNSAVQRGVVDFQYTVLKQNLLPKYQKFLLWLSLMEERWFLEAKEQHASGDAASNALRASSSKISSKQVGDELTNGQRDTDSTGKASRKSKKKRSSEKAGQTAMAFDKQRMWPLLCFELSISVDQEDRIFHQAYKRVREISKIQDCRAQIEAATRVALGLREAVLFQSHNVAARNRKTYLSILTPHQVAKYKEWVANNQEKFRNKARLMRRSTTQSLDDQNRSAEVESQTLMEVCRKLEDVLKITKGSGSSVEMMST